MSTRRTILRGLVAAALFGLLLEGAQALAATVGQKLSNVQINDANAKPAYIPDIGKKVVTIFYSDPDVSDQNDPFADKLKAAGLDKSKYRGVGIANLKDTWLPDSVILSIVRKKIEKYDATILTDPNYLLRDAWALGDCNEKSVVLILDKTATLRYIKKGAMTAAEIESGYQLVLKLMEE